MSVRSQRYIIRPASACPPGLRAPRGGPLPQVGMDIDEVARCAWNEILQTAPRATSLFAFLEDLLEPGPDLVWRGQGPGRGTEMRRSFSGLFGRFFARAYLQIHHGFVWFAAIDGNDFHLSPHWRVRRKPRSRTEMPDWVCAKAGELALGEAKGSHQKGNATRGGVPGPIKTAEGQLNGVLVQKRTSTPRGMRWQSKSVKGWAVMSRWGLASPSRDPFLYALDPETEGEQLSADELKDLVQAIARIHVEQTAMGLGLLKVADDQMVALPRRRMAVLGDPQKRTFTGTFLTPFGALDLDLERAKELSTLLPDTGLVRFVGLEEAVLQNFLEGQTLVARQSERIADRSLLGSDGLVVAPLDAVTDQSAQGGVG